MDSKVWKPLLHQQLLVVFSLRFIFLFEGKGTEEAFVLLTRPSQVRILAQAKMVALKRNNSAAQKFQCLALRVTGKQLLQSTTYRKKFAIFTT